MKKIKREYWIIIILINVLVLNYIFLTLKYLLPESAHLIGGKYIDTATSLMIIILMIYGFIIYSINK